MKTITIRGLEPAVVDALKKAAESRTVSMNRFIVEVLKDAVHMSRAQTRMYHDLDEFFGTWNEETYTHVREEVKRQRKIDKELWQ